MDDLYAELTWRGLVHAGTEGVADHLRGGAVTGYIGFDPTASSLHVGSLLQIVTLARLGRAGHRPLALLGGGTGLIGDPSGKSKERTLLAPAEVAENTRAIGAQIEAIYGRAVAESGARPLVTADNAEWLGSLSAIELLRDVGKHFSVNVMLARESVRRRIESEQGLSFTEFTYSILQAYDFLVLHERMGVSLQLGGSDQWGNIVAGADLVRSRTGHRVHGLTGPLITTASGAKFGKTEEGAVWLDAARTSPYRFFQFWMNVEDADVVRYLKAFTFLSQAEIDSLAAAHAQDAAARVAHRRLAEEATRMVHGEDGLARARRATEVFFGGGMDDVPVALLLEVFHDVPSCGLPRERFAGEGLPAADLLVAAGAAPSKKEARRALESGGAYLNNRRFEGPDERVTLERSLEGKLFVLRKGKRSYFVVRVEDGAS